MMTCIMYMMFSVIISAIIFNLNKFISMVKSINNEKKIPFECGFNPISKFSLPFSMPFFIISLLFLIFDIEITVMVPMIFYLKYSNQLYVMFIMLIFMSAMVITLFAEWFMGYLSWMF